MESMFGKVDCLVNKAGIMFPHDDPLPFHQQSKPTLDVNYRGTVALTKVLLPLLQNDSAQDPRVVNVASMAGCLSQVLVARQEQFSPPTLTLAQLDTLMELTNTKVSATLTMGCPRWR